jgi:polar amino acid transport system permease protein
VTYVFNWPIVFTYLPAFIGGLGIGLGIALAALVLGSIIGLALASVATDWPALFMRPVRIYVEVIRNVPLLLWAYFAFYGLPRLGVRSLDNYSSFVAALSLYAGAYLTEVFRSGLASIPARYREAAKSLGLTASQRLLIVTLPLMFRIVLPSLSNTFISLFKDTSIAAALAVPEVTFTAQRVNIDTFRIIEAWSIASVIYLGVGYFLANLLRLLERRTRMVR